MSLWPSFEYHEPAALDQALALLGESVESGEEDSCVMAGGVSLVLRMRAGFRPRRLVSLQRIAALSGIRREGASLQVGALTTVAELAGSPLIAEAAPLLTSACSNVATPRVRNMATLGGNVAQRDPNFDPPLALIALEAEALLVSSEGSRRVPVWDLYRGPEKLRGGEILQLFDIPIQDVNEGWAYTKFFPLSHDGTTGINVAARLQAREDGRIGRTVIVAGSVSSYPCRLPEAENRLNGCALTETALTQATAPIATEIEWVDTDQRGSAAYFSRIVPELVRRTLSEALGRAGAWK